MRVLSVVGFIRVRRVHSAAPCMSLGSFGFIGSIQMRSGRGVGSLGMFGRAQLFVGFIRVDLIHSYASSLFSVSFGFVGFERTLGVVGLIRVCSVLSGALGVVRFIWDRWVH